MATTTNIVETLKIKKLKNAKKLYIQEHLIHNLFKILYLLNQLKNYQKIKNYIYMKTTYNL